MSSTDTAPPETEGFDFAVIEASLWAEGTGPAGDLSWLARSREQPEAFRRALLEYWERLTGAPARSRPPDRYDFHYDLVERRRDSPAPALRWYRSGSGWRQWSYGELNRLAESRAAAWSEAGARAGDILAILHPIGPEWLAALLAGLRLGLVVSVLPPQGRAFVTRRLNALAPRWLAVDRLYLRGLPAEWRELALPDAPDRAVAPAPRFRGYSGDSPAALCFDPTSPAPDRPRPVSADTLYFGALRDGMLALGLRPGLSCAAPGWHVLETQPLLILAVLFYEATFVQIDPAELEREPWRLAEQTVDVLGVSRRVRDILRDHPVPGEKPWRYWFRHPAESTDLVLWQEFVERLRLGGAGTGNLVWNASLGGCLLFSGRRRGRVHQEVLPAAGLTFQLGSVASPDLPAPGHSGRLAVETLAEGQPAWWATPHLLAARGRAWLYLGAYPGGRAGRTYPEEEVLAVLANAGGYPALVEVPAAAGDGDALQILLAFGGEGDPAVWLERIETELGAEFRPDRVECLPLLPRRDAGGAADRIWCRTHYPTGEIHRRQRNPIYRCLSELKRLVLQK